MRGLLLASMAASEEMNAFGGPGSSPAAKPAMGNPDRLGCGQHGGLARDEQSPFLVVSGFQPGGIRAPEARVIDVAPTALRHLEVDASRMDGRPPLDNLCTNLAVSHITKLNRSQKDNTYA